MWLTECQKSSKPNRLFIDQAKSHNAMHCNKNNFSDRVLSVEVKVKMASTTFTSLAGFFMSFGACHGAIDSSVTVFGTTVGPNFKRAEGIRRYFRSKCETNN